MRVRHFVLITMLIAATTVRAAAQLPAAPPPAAAESASAGPVDTRVDPRVDRAIEQRIRATFETIPRLRDVQVSVEAGVVTLSGEVLSTEVRQEAERQAQRVEGVVTVENNVEIVRDVRRRLQPTIERLSDTLFAAVGALPLLVVALLIAGVFYALSAFFGRWRWLYGRFTDNLFLQDLLSHVVRVAVILVGLVLALQVLDAFTLVTAILGTAGVVGLILGLAFRDIAENYIAGALLSLRQPFLPYDAVRIEGYEGKIIQLTSRATLVMTWDGNHVRIPNATVIKSIIRNYSRNPQRRFDFVLRIGLDQDPARAIELGVDAMRNQPGVLPQPEPEAWIDEVGDGAILVHYFGWINQNDTSWPKAKSEAIRLVKGALDHAGIALTRPGYDVRVSAEPTAPAPAPEAPAPVLDVSVERHIDRQIDEDRARSKDRDLLSTEPPAPRT